MLLILVNQEDHSRVYIGRTDWYLSVMLHWALNLLQVVSQ